MTLDLSDEDKKYILNEYLRNISDISNKRYQERVWILGEGPEVDDFDESVCHFFDDGDPILKKYRDYNITESQYLLLKQFRDKFKAFSKEHDFPEEFIDTPEWARIMEMANEVLVAFDYKKSAIRRQILDSFLENLSGISDKEYLQKAWIEGKEADFDESVCLFFDLGDPILENHKEFGITESQYLLLKQFRDEFKTFSKEHDLPEEFIDTPEWARIMEMAKEVLVAFDYQN
ncbi:MAG: hypothetical protein K940chlam2_01178 [Chlamydiae bacterium]|nr:hypothetical protein [Chlamydiota bacterium]